MKKKRKYLAILMCFLITLSLSVSASAEVGKKYKSDQIYMPSILPGTEAWRDLKTHKEKVDVCRVPDEILCEMTTEALVRTVFEYPLLPDMLFYNAPIEGFMSVLQSYNGLNELIHREDAATEMMRFYNKLRNGVDEVPEGKELSFASLQLIIMILGYNDNHEEITYSDLSEQERFLFDIYPALSGGFLYSFRTDIYTPGGILITPDWCIYDRPELTRTEIMNINHWVYENYPNVVQVSGRGPTNKYNCHSYAWYDQSASNLWWIGHCEDFIRDTATFYQNTNPNTTLAEHIGEIVVYKTMLNTTPYEHSGIIYRLVGNSLMVRSKWGSMGLYEHYIYDCPYSSYVDYFARW